MHVLIHLHIGGRAMLKDIVRRESIPAPNLCAAFRRLESDGLVLRSEDECDRRNVWYSVSESGADVARRALAALRVRLAGFFDAIGAENGGRLIEPLRRINETLNKVKNEIVSHESK
jgi:DNA-binding MarR family transcriptional regulator